MLVTIAVAIITSVYSMIVKHKNSQKPSLLVRCFHFLKGCSLHGIRFKDVFAENLPGYNYLANLFCSYLLGEQFSGPFSLPNALYLL